MKLRACQTWCSIFEPLSWCGAEHATENNTGRYIAFAPEWSGPYPYTFTRGPELWEQRLREHFAPRGVTITGHYLKVNSCISSSWVPGCTCDAGPTVKICRGTGCTARRAHACFATER